MKLPPRTPDDHVRRVLRAYGEPGDGNDFGRGCISALVLDMLALAVLGLAIGAVMWVMGR